MFMQADLMLIALSPGESGARLALREPVYDYLALMRSGHVAEPSGCGAHFYGFDYVGDRHCGPLVYRCDVGGRFGIKDADRPAGSEEEEPSQIADFRADLGVAAGGIGGCVLSGRVLVPRHPGQVAEHEEQGHQVTVDRSRRLTDRGNGVPRVPTSVLAGLSGRWREAWLVCPALQDGDRSAGFAGGCRRATGHDRGDLRPSGAAEFGQDPADMGVDGPDRASSSKRPLSRSAISSRSSAPARAAASSRASGMPSR